ncbi:hypothetical protein [Ruminococcus sp.]|jgi:hypothetical protein|uniref:hypothetical protein n=1 Tax=Ruminococcus sp. TaxID=41978 RepID=UPI0025FE0B96|nr:hypothetical protein [Ruminococcus sp.]
MRKVHREFVSVVLLCGCALFTLYVSSGIIKRTALSRPNFYIDIMLCIFVNGTSALFCFVLLGE